MSLFLHICAGLGIALAAGIRPFTPALLAGALAGARVVHDFHGTHFAFLAGAGFLLAVVALWVVVVLIRTPLASELTACGGIVLGGLLFAAILAAHGNPTWPGLVAGAFVAAIATAATRPIFGRAAERLDDGAAQLAVSFYADAVALSLAAVCWFAGPVALVALVPLLALAWRGRHRSLAQLAALRVLR